MIITHINAENVLKYRMLSLADLPRSGVITISGQNESGKSTIGETVCFALFGRTFSIGENDDITRIIRWGEPRCSVRLGFSIGDDEYEIARFLDSEGGHGARLYHVGEEDRPIAKGVNAVNDMLANLLGYQFEEFVESFYLAQREITTPHPHSHAIKTMAGISALERVADELAREIDTEKNKLPEASEQIEVVEGDITDLAIEPDKLAKLDADLDSVTKAGALLRQREESLERAADQYRKTLPQLAAKKRSGRIFGLLAFLALIITSLSGAIWYLGTYSPGSEYNAVLNSLMETYVPAHFQEHVGAYTANGAAFALASVLFLLFWLMSRSKHRQAREIRKSGEILAEQILAVQEPVAGLDSENSQREANPAQAPLNSESEETSAAIPGSNPTSRAVIDDASTDTVANQADSVSMSQLASLRECKLDNAGVQKLLAAPLQQLTELHERQQMLQRTFENAVSTEQERHTRVDALNGVIKNLKSKLDQITHRIRIRELAGELISAASRNFSQRFNRDLRELASRTLPLFTEERYEHLHIDNDLNVQAFSSLKRDYMDLDEISSGTQRQIMLAVRLALSQELVNTTGSGNQFIFLDEPFAFFDQTRTRNAMAILPKLSDEINQVWVIAQEFPDDTATDHEIHCSREFDSLPASENLA